MTGRRLGVVATVLVVVFACGGELREDEQVCEEALAHLRNCCSGYPESVSCQYVSGCASNAHTPEIDAVTSDCLRARSCGELASQGLCRPRAYSECR